MGICVTKVIGLKQRPHKLGVSSEDLIEHFALSAPLAMLGPEPLSRWGILEQLGLADRQELNEIGVVECLFVEMHDSLDVQSAASTLLREEVVLRLFHPVGLVGLVAAIHHKRALILKSI